MNIETIRRVTSVVYHNQLWNFAGVVFGFHAERNTKKQEEASPCLIVLKIRRRKNIKS